jgi:hypothetical protein
MARQQQTDQKGAASSRQLIVINQKPGEKL